MSVLQLHRSTVAVCPCKNLPAVPSVPGHRRLGETSGNAGEGDVLPYVSRHVDRCLREQWARCARRASFPLFSFSEKNKLYVEH